MRSHDRIDELGMSLHTEIEYQLPRKSTRSGMQSNMTRAEFEKSVYKAKEAINEGELFQCTLAKIPSADSSRGLHDLSCFEKY